MHNKPERNTMMRAP